MTPEKRAAEARKQARDWFSNMFGNVASVSRKAVTERVAQLFERENELGERSAASTDLMMSGEQLRDEYKLKWALSESAHRECIKEVALGARSSGRRCDHGRPRPRERPSS